MSTLIFQDNCTGTNGSAVHNRVPDTLGDQWLNLIGPSGTWDIQSNKIRYDYGSSGVPTSRLAKPLSATPNDQSIIANWDFSAAAALDFACGFYLRFTNDNNVIRAWVNKYNTPNIFMIDEIASGVTTTLAQSSFAISANDEVQAKVIGTTVTLSVNGVVKLTGTTSVVSGDAGLAGVTGSTVNFLFDNIRVYDETGGGGGGGSVVPTILMLHSRR